VEPDVILREVFAVRGSRSPASPDTG
jgi:hypothetical protein